MSHVTLTSDQAFASGETMKKLIVGLLAAFLMTSGLVAFSSTSASARPADCPYSGCVDTATGAAAEVRARAVVIAVRTVAIQSNSTPKGRITLTVTKRKKNGNLREVTTIFSRLNERGITRFRLSGLKPGRYLAAAEYENNEKFGFNYSSDNVRFRVKRR
jgi:hypothetical protein